MQLSLLQKYNMSPTLLLNIQRIISAQEAAERHVVLRDMYQVGVNIYNPDRDTKTLE